MTLIHNMILPGMAGRIVLNVLPTVNEDTFAFTLMEAISKEYLLRRVRIYIGVELTGRMYTYWPYAISTEAMN